MKRLLVASAFLVALAAGLAGSEAASARSSFAVYLVRAEVVAPVRRTGASPRAAIAALLRGPTAAERRQGYTSAIPPATRLLGVSRTGDVLVVDLARRFESGGGSLSMLLRVAQVVHTATQFPGVERVAFRLDGRPATAIGGEGVIVAPPVHRADFEGQAPRILVERPLPGDRVSTPITVRGTANVFEAQFLVDIETPRGAVVAHRAVHATGSRGSFMVRIPVTKAAQHLVVVAYDRSAKDGSRVDVVRVPVTLAVPPAPTVTVSSAAVDRTARTVDARLRICFVAGPDARIAITEQRALGGRVVARRSWSPEGEKAAGLRGPGTYTASVRVRDAYGRWTPRVVIVTS